MNEISLKLIFFILPLICVITYYVFIFMRVLKSSYSTSLGIILGTNWIPITLVYIIFINLVWLPLSDKYWVYIDKDAMPLFDKIGYIVVCSWFIIPVLLFIAYYLWRYIKEADTIFNLILIENNIKKRIPEEQINELLNKIINDKDNNYGDSYIYDYFTNKEIMCNHWKITKLLNKKNIKELITIEKQLVEILNNMKLLNMNIRKEYDPIMLYNINSYYQIYLEGDNDDDPEIQGVEMILKGTIGEEEVKQEIENYFYFDSKRLYDVNLKVENGSGKINKFENDIILINQSGIYTIEIKNKNYGGKLIINSDGSTNEDSNSLTSQMDYHEKLLKLYLFEEFPNLRNKIHDIVKSFAILTNDDVKVINNCYENYKVIKKNMIGSQIKINENKMLTDKEINQIYHKIKKDSEINHEGRYPFFELTEEYINSRTIILEKYKEEMKNIIYLYNKCVVSYYDKFRNIDGEFNSKLDNNILKVLKRVE